MKDDEINWLKEYAEFINTEEKKVPEELRKKVMNCVCSLLNPNPWKIFSKLLFVQLVIGFFSLSVCHQFGVNPFNTSFSLDSWLMNTVGHNACMLGCGIFFVALGTLASGLWLTRDEARVLNKNIILQVGALSLLSLVAFFTLGAELIIVTSLLWLIGGFIGGTAAVKGIRLLQRA